MEKPGGKGMAAMTERERRVQWFQEARFGTVPQYTYPLPDPIDTVLEIEYQYNRRFSGCGKTGACNQKCSVL